MTLQRTSKTLVLLALCAISVASVQDAVLLRRKLGASSKDTYKVASVTKIVADTPAGAQEGSALSDSTIVVTTGNGSPDSAPVTVVTTVDSMKMDGMMGAAGTPPKVPPVTLSGTLDGRNRVTNVKVADAGGAANPMSMLGGVDSSQLGVFVEFPEAAVKEGDTWTINIPANPMMGKDPQNLTAKFVGSRDVAGKKVYVVTVTGPLKIEPDMEAIKKANKGGTDMTMGMDLKIKGTADISSENLIDPATGATVESTNHIKGKTDVEIVQMQMNTKVTTDTTVKMTRAN